MGYIFTTQNLKANITYDGKQVYSLVAEADERIKVFIDTVKPDKKYVVEVKEYRAKRSLDSNSYAWTLLAKLGHTLGSTKEDIYREIIRSKNISSEVVPVRADAVGKWIANWESRGVGWCCEDLGVSKIDNYHRVICNFGSSTFDSKEMSLFIDEVVSECHNAGVETMTPQEIATMNAQWGETK